MLFTLLLSAGGQLQCQRCRRIKKLIHKAGSISGQNLQAFVSEGQGSLNKRLFYHGQHTHSTPHYWISTGPSPQTNPTIKTASLLPFSLKLYNNSSFFHRWTHLSGRRSQTCLMFIVYIWFITAICTSLLNTASLTFTVFNQLHFYFLHFLWVYKFLQYLIVHGPYKALVVLLF